MKARKTLFAPKGGARPSSYDQRSTERDRFAERRVITLRRSAATDAAMPQRTGGTPARRLGVDETPPDTPHVKKFTLRLDPHRHLRFHLVTQLDKVSGQILLVRLLDRYMEQRLGTGSRR